MFKIFHKILITNILIIFFLKNDLKNIFLPKIKKQPQKTVTAYHYEINQWF